MAAVDATLAWAQPVKVEVLGAHLQAYIDLLPTINTLRLCNRFGQGPNAYISKLPLELVQKVEKYLVEGERQERLVEWNRVKKCFECTCDDTDHFTEEEIHRIFDHHYDCCWNDDGLSDGWKQGRFSELVDFDQWYDIHCKRRNDWAHKVSRPSSQQHGFFSESQDIMYKHFGLNVWTSVVRLEEQNYVIECDATETTIGYLTLPPRSSASEDWSLSMSELECGDWKLETGCGMVIENTAQPSKQSLKRFPRAMKILGLETCLDEDKHVHVLDASEMPAGADTKKRKEDDHKAQIWPRLMLLVRSEASPGP